MKYIPVGILLAWVAITTPFMAKMAYRSYHKEKELRSQGFVNIGPIWFKSTPNKKP